MTTIDTDVDILDVLEERAEALYTTVDFLHGQATEEDETAIRAMLVYGATDDQIVKSFTIAAVATQVCMEDKSRYAFGVLKRLVSDAKESELLERYEGGEYE
jgi:hypothetical protein